jgi:hypothetical protein
MSTYRTKRTLKASGRRFATIGKADEKLSIDRRVYLPFDLATVHAAAQNFRIELAKGTHRYLDEWELYKSSYLSEALEYMQDDGCNLYPGHNDEPWIHVGHSYGLIQMPSLRASDLVDLYECWFVMNDESLLKCEDFPCPTKINSAATIEAAANRFDQRFMHN